MSATTIITSSCVVLLIGQESILIFGNILSGARKFNLSTAIKINNEEQGWTTVIYQFRRLPRQLISKEKNRIQSKGLSHHVRLPVFHTFFCIVIEIHESTSYNFIHFSRKYGNQHTFHQRDKKKIEMAKKRADKY